MTLATLVHAPACDPLPSNWHALLLAWEAARLAPPRKTRGWAVRNRCYAALRWMFDHGAELRYWTDLTPDLVIRFIDARQASGASAPTIVKDVQALKSFLFWCEAREPHSPRLSHLLTRLAPAMPSKDPDALTHAQEAELLDIARKQIKPDARGFGAVRDWPLPNFWLLCRIGLVMGLRPGELKCLHWRDLHLDAPTPFLKLTDKSPHWQLKTPLAATPLEIPPDLLLNLHNFRKISYGRGRKGDSFLFTTDEGKAPFYDHIWRHLAVILRAPGLNCQWLRHTCATRRTEQGWSLEQIRNWLRHTTTQTCEKYYVARSQGVPLAFATSKRPGERDEQRRLF